MESFSKGKIIFATTKEHKYWKIMIYLSLTLSTMCVSLLISYEDQLSFSFYSHISSENLPDDRLDKV